jgi:uncharacterized protein YneF (UPF0154 family)
MQPLFTIALLILFGAFIGAVEITVARMHTEPAFKSPPPMTLEETKRFFSTFKLEAGQ